MRREKQAKETLRGAAIKDLKAIIINMFKELKEVMHKEVDKVVVTI